MILKDFISMIDDGLFDHHTLVVQDPRNPESVLKITGVIYREDKIVLITPAAKASTLAINYPPYNKKDGPAIRQASRIATYEGFVPQSASWWNRIDDIVSHWFITKEYDGTND